MDALNGPLAPNRDDVVAKTIDGELIVIRLSDGTYYSMDGVGARVWGLLERHQDLPTMVATVSRWYEVAPETLERDLAALLAELRAEGLITAAEGVPVDGAEEAPPAATLPYEAPRLNVYRDMGNLLALDPPTPGIDDLRLKGGK